MHNTTEHLVHMAEVFRTIAKLLRSQGVLIFSHHNYYVWNGHHLAPKSVSAIDPADEKQRKVMDWAHIEPDAELRSYLATRVNRITLDELRSLTEQEYAIEEWKESGAT